MVEILSGVVVGAGVARDVGSLFSTWDRSIDAGHVFNRHRPGAIHPAPDVSRARRGAAGVGAGGSSSGGGEAIRYPGEIRPCYAAAYGRDGIPCDEAMERAIDELTVEFGVRWPC